MRTLAITICVILSSTVTVAASETLYKARFATDIQGGINLSEQVARIVISTNDLYSPSLRQLDANTSYSVGIPYHGLSEVKLPNLQTYIDPHALAAMIEQSLNTNKVTLSEVMDYLNTYDWLKGPPKSLRAKLISPRNFRVTYQEIVTSGARGGSIRTSLVITGPNLVDEKTRQPSAEESYGLTIPSPGLETLYYKNRNTYVDPRALAVMLEDALNRGAISIREAKESLLRDRNWIFARNFPLYKKLQAPEKYRVSFQEELTSGRVPSSKSARLYITGPDLQIDGVPTSMESYSVRIPFHGLTDIRLQSKGFYVDPHVFAARTEAALNQGRVSIDEVDVYVSESQWLTNGSLQGPIFRKIMSEDGVYSCKFLMSL